MRQLRCLLFLLAPSGSAVRAQRAVATLEVTGGVKQALRLTTADLAALPRATVEANDHGVATTFQGVWLHEILKRAGAPAGPGLAGKALASYLIETAQDGYQVVFSLAELDPLFSDNPVLLADPAGGKPLTGARDLSGSWPGSRSEAHSPFAC